jgi:hypothetical protein
MRLSHSSATTTRSNRGFELSPRVRLSKTVMQNPASHYIPYTAAEIANRFVQPLYAQTGLYASPTDSGRKPKFGLSTELSHAGGKAWVKREWDEQPRLGCLAACFITGFFGLGPTTEVPGCSLCSLHTSLRTANPKPISRHPRQSLRRPVPARSPLPSA